MDWPSPLRNKGVFYVKREPRPLPEKEGVDLLDHLTCGDIHPNTLGTHLPLVHNKHTYNILCVLQTISAPWSRRFLSQYSATCSTSPSSRNASQTVRRRRIAQRLCLRVRQNIFPDIERQVHELSTSVYQVSLMDLTSVLCCTLSCRCGATSRGRRYYPSHRSDFPHGLLLV